MHFQWQHSVLCMLPQSPLLPILLLNIDKKINVQKISKYSLQSLKLDYENLRHQRWKLKTTLSITSTWNGLSLVCINNRNPTKWLIRNTDHSNFNWKLPVKIGWVIFKPKIKNVTSEEKSKTRNILNRVWIHRTIWNDIKPLTGTWWLDLTEPWVMSLIHYLMVLWCNCCYGHVHHGSYHGKPKLYAKNRSHTNQCMHWSLIWYKLLYLSSKNELNQMTRALLKRDILVFPYIHTSQLLKLNTFDFLSDKSHQSWKNWKSDPPI